MLINAGTLVNGTTIRLLPLAGLPSMFNYWHVELENHEVVPVNGGVPAESFIDYVGRSGFDNYDDYLDLVGADRLITEMPFARISARRLLPANGLRGCRPSRGGPSSPPPGKPPPDANIRSPGFRFIGRPKDSGMKSSVSATILSAFGRGGFHPLMKAAGTQAPSRRSR